MQYPTLKNYAGNYIRIGVSGPALGTSTPGACRHTVANPRNCYNNSIMRGNGQTYAVGQGAQPLGNVQMSHASFAPYDYVSQGYTLPRAANPNCMSHYNQWFAGNF